MNSSGLSHSEANSLKKGFTTTDLPLFTMIFNYFCSMLSQTTRLMMLCAFLGTLFSIAGLVMSASLYIDIQKPFCPIVGFLIGYFILNESIRLGEIFLAVLMLVAWLIAEILFVPGQMSYSYVGLDVPFYYHDRHDLISYFSAIVAGLLYLLVRPVAKLKRQGKSD